MIHARINQIISKYLSSHKIWKYDTDARSDSPHAIALGFSLGVFISFTPLLGFHLLLAICMAFMIRVNSLAAVIGTCIGNPMTYPLMWFASYNIGKDLVQTLPFQEMTNIFIYMAVGGTILGLICAVIGYFPVRTIVKNRLL